MKKLTDKEKEEFKDLTIKLMNWLKINGQSGDHILITPDTSFLSTPIAIIER